MKTDGRFGLCGRVAVAAMATLLLLAAPQDAPGQRLNRSGQSSPQAKKSRKKTTAPPSRSDQEALKPQTLNLNAPDGVLIAATYFPSKGGRNAPAVILLHGYGETQNKLWDLAFALQDSGYAVVTFDARGHGFSRTVVAGAGSGLGRRGTKINFRDLGRKLPFQSLILDLDAVKNFLVEENNAGHLNLSKLALVGCHMGANTAIIWALRDWLTPRPDFQDKTGQDVQALVLVSPRINFKGYSAVKELSKLAASLPVLVIAGGGDRKAAGDARKIYQVARRGQASGRGLPSESQFQTLDTKLQGTKLLNPKLKLGTDAVIIKFLNDRLKGRIVQWEKHQKRGE